MDYRLLLILLRHCEIIEKTILLKLVYYVLFLVNLE